MNVDFVSVRPKSRVIIAFELLVGVFTMLLFGKAHMKHCRDDDKLVSEPQAD
jgi:hypothetical protein